jgi:hypothetical protein
MDSENYTIGVRLQKMGFTEQALILARFGQARFQGGQFTPKQLQGLFEDSSLPPPTNISDVVGKLRSKGLLTKALRFAKRSFHCTYANRFGRKNLQRR